MRLHASLKALSCTPLFLIVLIRNTYHTVTGIVISISKFFVVDIVSRYIVFPPVKGYFTATVRQLGYYIPWMRYWCILHIGLNIVIIIVIRISHASLITSCV